MDVSSAWWAIIAVSIVMCVILMNWTSKIRAEQGRREAEFKVRKTSLDSASSRLAAASEDQRKRLAREEMDWRREKQRQERAIEAQKEAVLTLATQRSQGFPLLADAYAEYFELQGLRIANHLEQKSHPAVRAAEQVREAATKLRTSERERRVLKYQLAYYESLFPWLTDLQGEDVSSLTEIAQGDNTGEPVSEGDDQAKRWLDAAEYRNLPTAERYQLALDRYWRSRKSRWEIGRDFERYVGYWYELNGFQVYYQGIIDGFDDLGRDLIARKGNKVEIIQCKRWSKDKIIHEKHIFQLYGTLVAYMLDNPTIRASGLFITSTSLSERAREFARALGITVVEGFKIEAYPCIKCNVSSRDSTKIYHLPFDQQYDRTQIDPARGERYVETVKEAEGLGFRRAVRWRGTG